MKEKLLSKLHKRESTIGLIGLGYVGIPLARRFLEVGFKTIGFDVDTKKIDLLKKGESYIRHIPDSAFSQMLESGFEATGDFSRISEADALIVCVPTPLTKHRDPDLSYVTDTAETLAQYIRPGQVISLESTTYPGTTEEELLPRLEQSGLTVGKDFFLVYSPEREDPGNSKYTTQTIPKVCGGHTAACHDIGIALYKQIVDEIVPVSSTPTAEFVKLLENIHRAVNIGLVNELKILADKMDIDIFEVIKAAATKPFGFTAYYPGPGLGGHCIPVDPFYLSWKAKEFDHDVRFIELAGEINRSMPDYVVSKVTWALNQHQKSVKGSKILVLGLAYKKNIDDMRESPSIPLIESLGELGAELTYCDPYVPSFTKITADYLNQNSTEITREILLNFDCTLLVTDHDCFDYELLQSASKLLVDTRGRYDKAHDNVVRG